MDNKDQQKEEIDLLMNIVPDKLKVNEDDDSNYILEFTILASVEEPKMNFELKIKLGSDYPNIEPELELNETNNYLSNTKLDELQQNLKNICQEYIGMPVVYQIYEAVQTFADEEEQNIINEQIKIEKEEIEQQKKLEEQLRKEEEELLQNQTYTPVTKELFDEWYKNFVKEQHSKKVVSSADKRLSGREFFLNKNLKLEENEINEDEIVTEKTENKNEELEPEQFEAEVFEEDINDIDFDNDDNIEDL